MNLSSLVNQLIMKELLGPGPWLSDHLAISAYTAGIIDGEGCISIAHGPNRGNQKETGRLRIVVGNTNKILVEFLGGIWGGYVRCYKPQTRKHKIPYYWELPLSRGKEFLQTIYPYLLLKKRQANIAMEYINLKQALSDERNWTYTKEQLWQIGVLRRIMRRLNKRGRQA